MAGWAMGHPGAAVLLLQLMRAERAGLAAMIGMGALAAVVAVLPSIIVRQFVDVAVPSHNMTAVVLGAVGLALILVADGTLRFGVLSLRFRIGEAMCHAMRERLYRKYLNLPLATFSTTPSGEFVTRVMNDTVAAQIALLSAIPVAVVNASAAVVMAVWLSILDWRMTVLALILLPFVVVASSSGSRTVHRASTQGMETLSELVSRMSQTLDMSGAALVQLSNTGEAEGRRFADVSRRYVGYSVLRLRTTAAISLVTSCVAAVGTGIVIGYGGWSVVRGDTSLGTLLAFVTVLGLAYSPISSLSSARADLATSAASLIRVSDALQWPSRPQVAPKSRKPEEAPVASSIALRFEKVTFTYPRDGDDSNGSDDVPPKFPAVDEVDFVVPAGATIAVVGPSGSGKTSLARLATGLVQPDSGRVLVGERDVQGMPEAERAALMAMVTQDTFLFSDTLAANIAYGCADIDLEWVQEAGRVAGLDEVVARMPDAYLTAVGENGFRLSGGERQRVAIARALMRRPGLLILDEPTSHLDLAIEERLRASLSAAWEGRTCLLITHRLRLAEDADLVVVMDAGQVVEIGPPAGLAAADGPFAILRAMDAAFSRSRGL